MTRLDELYELQRMVDDEITRELEALSKMATLRDTTRDLLATTRTNVVQILFAVSEAYDVPLDAIKSKSMVRHVVEARHIAIWLLHDQGMPFAEIGRELGKDHTTAMYAVRRVGTTPRLLAVAASIRGDLPSRVLDIGGRKVS